MTYEETFSNLPPYFFNFLYFFKGLAILFRYLKTKIEMRVGLPKVNLETKSLKKTIEPLNNVQKLEEKKG